LVCASLLPSALPKDIILPLVTDLVLQIKKNDDVVPSLDSCKKRASIEGEVTHNALEDAWDVVKLLRTKY
jgi:hypothetical protein